MMKMRIFLIALIVAFSSTGFAQETKYQLSSHILDITQGEPAPNVKIALSKQDKDGEWKVIDEKYTDKNGRVGDFLKQTEGATHQGIFKLTYFVEPYFKTMKTSTFYPFIDVVFEIKDGKHYHVPITLSPFGYATYRGS